MSLIDKLARVLGDGPWTREQAIRNAERSAQRSGNRYEVVEVEPGRWVSRRVRHVARTRRADGSIVITPTEPE